MRAIVEVSTQYGGNQETEWVDISDRVIGDLKIRYAYEGTSWSYGVAKCGITRLRCENADDYLSPSNSPNSLFSHSGIDKTMLRIRYEEHVIFLGFLTSRTTMADRVNNIANLVVRSIENILQNVSAGKLEITGTLTRVGVLNAIFAIPEIKEVIPDYYVDLDDRVSDGDAEYHADELLQNTNTILDVVNKFLKIEDATFSYDYSLGTFVIVNRGKIPLSRPLVLTDIMDILEVSDGSERTFNNIAIDFRDPVGRDFVINDGSIEAYGMRPLNIDGKFVSIDEIDSVKEFLNSRLSKPFMKVKIILKAENPDIIDNRWNLGEQVILSSLRLPIPVGGATYSTDKPVSPKDYKQSVFSDSVYKDGRALTYKELVRTPNFPRFSV